MFHNRRQQAGNRVLFNFWKIPAALLLLTVTLADSAEEAGEGQTSSTPLAASASTTQQQQIVDRHGSDEKELGKDPEKVEGQPKETHDIMKEHKELMARIKDNTGHNGIDWEVSRRCLNCLCYFATDCDLQRQCETPDPTDDLEPGMEKGDCGPFHISLPFWADGNNVLLILGDAVMENEWRKCSLDLDCATKSIQRYFHKYPVDCNKDGKIDCIDYAAIHTLGPFGCQKQEALATWYKKRSDTMLNCMVNDEEGRYTKKMQELEEKLKKQDIAAMKNELKKDENKSTKPITQEIEHKTETQMNPGAGKVEAKPNADETHTH